MRIDTGLVLGILLEYLLMLYFANTTFYPKTGYIKSGVISFAGYAILFAVNTAGYPAVSITVFFIINYLCIILGYNVNSKTAVYSSLLLDVLSVISEYVVLIIMKISYNFTAPTVISPHQSFVLTVTSKLIYFVCLVLIKKIGKKQKNSDDDEPLLLLVLVPITTIICLTVMMHMDVEIKAFEIICISMLIMNIMVFAVDEIIRLRNRELKFLREENSKNQLYAAECGFISAQYESIHILKHDLKKHLGILKELIKTNSQEAQAYIQHLLKEQSEINYEKYTNNAVLNILLSQKLQECKDKEIKLQITVKYSKYDFLSDVDTAAIFSNLIDNAIEACERSDEKSIFIDLYAANNIFPSVKIENSADSAPVILNNVFRTQKEHGKLHGFGIKSINKAIKKYKGNLFFSYDDKNKFFRMVIILNP